MTVWVITFNLIAKWTWAWNVVQHEQWRIKLHIVLVTLVSYCNHKSSNMNNKSTDFRHTTGLKITQKHAGTPTGRAVLNHWCVSINVLVSALPCKGQTELQSTMSASGIIFPSCGRSCVGSYFRREEGVSVLLALDQRSETGVYIWRPVPGLPWPKLWVWQQLLRPLISEERENDVRNQTWNSCACRTQNVCSHCWWVCMVCVYYGVCIHVSTGVHVCECLCRYCAKADWQMTNI